MSAVNQISKQFLLIFSVFFLLSVVFFSDLIYQKSKKNYSELLNIVNNTVGVIFQNDKIDHDNFIENYAKSENITDNKIRISVIDSSGKVIYDSQIKTDKLDNHINRTEIAAALKGKSNTLVRKSNSVNKKLLFTASPIYKNHKIIGVVRSSVELNAIILENIKLTVCVILFLLVFSIIIICILKHFNNDINKSINKINKSFKKLSSGTNTVLELNNSSELAELSANFNNLIKQITELTEEVKTGEKLKKDFIINISHELKTPLTAIYGFIETLEDELNENKNSLSSETINNCQEYINIIKRHTNRLVAIVQDLLLLSEMESSDLPLVKTETNIKQLIYGLLPIFSQRLEEKGLQLKIEFQNNFDTMSVDVFTFEQIFINLIDNAVKYSDKGTIYITAKADDNFAYFSIKDEGIGIKKELTDRLFERFYTVDKSRSRSTGGTGLGLSIVKHIVLRYNGTISVQSELGEGSEFIVKLPKK